MTSTRIRSILSGLALGAALAAAAVSMAGPASLARPLDPAVTVRYDDLNLYSASGTRTLYARLQNAAARVCGPSLSLWNGRRWSEWKDCYSTTIDVCVRRIDQPLLTALHRQKATARPG